MAKTFGNALAFKASLEDRLKRVAAERGVTVNALRLKLVIERLLARLFANAEPSWLLKGGYAMELRYRPRARTTRDIDLTVSQRPTGKTLAARLDLIRDELQTAASVDLGDYLQFVISPAQTELQGAPDGGARFPCVATLASKVYERFHIDLGFGDAVTGTPETLIGDDLLAFAEIAPAKVPAVPREQQFAEKLHAYTLARGERVNTRTKDLVDLLLLMETHPFDPISLRLAVAETFGLRATHAVPMTLLPPPESWAGEFTRMAAEMRLSTIDLKEGFSTLQAFWVDSDNASERR